jgi:hypothetical protein
MDSLSNVPTQTSPKKYWVFIGGAFLILSLLGIATYFYFKSIKNSLNSPTASPSTYSSSSSTPSSRISDVSPCGKYQDEAGLACSQDGVKAYNNALSNQLGYICKANGKKNQYDQCIQMCQNGQFNGLPMCRSCCVSVCSSMVCPPAGRGGGGEAGGGKSECATICRLQPNSEYCRNCSKVE